MARKKSQGMTEEHKKALAEGRAQSRAVKNYLEALEAHKPRRGRKRSPESIRRRLDRIHQELPDADPLKELQLTQERMDLERELETLEQKDNLKGLEKEFVKNAKGYSERKGISYKAWREVGVPAAVLKEAGIGRAG